MLRFLRSRTSEFLPRSQSRDESNDADRIAAVLQALEGALESIEREKGGLRDRYETARTNASMYIQAADGESSTRAMESRLSELEKSVVYYESRMTELAKQSEEIRGMCEAANKMRQNVSVGKIR